MAKNLVIVESPAKAKTIKRYLGRDFQVTPSVGHVVDLPKSKLGVDIEHDFKPEYHVIPARPRSSRISRTQAKGKDHIYLATDPDREGEAIAWHIADQLGKGSTATIHRILLHEITKTAVKEAIAHPTELNQHLFDAQQARRVLDRLVGYQISPLLWDKVKRGISAGRVQSVALRIIVEREKEREAFRAEEYWTLDAHLEGKQSAAVQGQALQPRRPAHRQQGLQASREAKRARSSRPARSCRFTVASIERKEVRRSPTPPFITSRLQQEAARKLYFSPSRTMKIAQRLYEGVELGEAGRDRSYHLYAYRFAAGLATQALDMVRGYIANRYGKDYLPDQAELLSRLEVVAGCPRGDSPDRRRARSRIASRITSTRTSSRSTR